MAVDARETSAKRKRMHRSSDRTMPGVLEEMAETECTRGRGKEVKAGRRLGRSCRGLWAMERTCFYPEGGGEAWEGLKNKEVHDLNHFFKCWYNNIKE